jgi:hypothetical protein
MRRMSLFVFLFVFALGLLGGAAHAQTQTGTVLGRITDVQGGVLPGATVVLNGPRGSQTTVTDGQGQFRFVGVIPASYSVKVELSGFATQEENPVIVGMGKTSTVNFTLKIGGVTETVEVVGMSSGIDLKSSATDTPLTQELLTSMPIFDATATDLLNNAPGINSGSGYGGQADYGNALLLDGVDTRDPEGGSAWTFFNQDLIQEIQIGGLGAPAEYGGFTGAIVNTITKSGSNLFSSLFSIRYTNNSLASNNLSQAILDANPDLGEADITKKLVDYTVQLGGPIKKDKAFFYASIQRYSAETDPSGPLNKATDVSPRLNFKFTLQPNSSNTIILGTQYDQYNVTGRIGYWPSSQATYDQTVTEDAPEWVWNAQWRKVFGSSTLLEAKFTGYTGYYYLDPVDPAPFTIDYPSETYSGGGGGLYYADRSRNQLNVALTKYAEKFGKHSLKFGFEIERSHVRSQYQPYGPAGFYVYAYYGTPNYRVSYGYDVQGDNRRQSFYAQDQWSLNRLTLNIGVRLDHITGYSPVLKQNVYEPGLAWGPRVGAAFDILGTGTSVLKGFWGRYFEGTATGFYTQATPGLQPTLATIINPDGSLGDTETWVPSVVYGISQDIHHPEVNEFNVAWEQAVGKNLHLTVSGIWRTTKNFINNVITGAEWDPVELTNQLTGQPFTGYYWANRDATEENYFIRNVAGYQYMGTDGNVIATADPQRKYKALMLLFSRPLRNRWGFQVSYVLAKAEGSLDNTGFSNWLQGMQWDSPNTGVINNYGELTNSRRHEMKLYATYLIPRAEVMISGAYTGRSGQPYTPYGQFSTDDLNLPSSNRRQIWLAPRGSLRNDFYNNLDLRVEKVFQYGPHRFGFYVDVMNLFNIATVTEREDRVPGSGSVNYQAPTEVQGARQVTFGARWSF